MRLPGQPLSRLGSLATAVSGGFWPRDSKGSNQHTNHSQAAMVKQNLGRRINAGTTSGSQLALEQCMMPLTGDHVLDAVLPAQLHHLYPHRAHSLSPPSEIVHSLSPPSTVSAACSSHTFGASAGASAGGSGDSPVARVEDAFRTQTAAVHHSSSMMVSLPGHTQLVRGASALLTGLVLPERAAYSHSIGGSRLYSQGSMVFPASLADVDATVSLSRRQSQGSCSIAESGSIAACGDRSVSVGGAAIMSSSSVLPAPGISLLRSHLGSGVGLQLLSEDARTGAAVCLDDMRLGLAELVHAPISAVSHHSQGPMLLVGPHGEVSFDSIKSSHQVAAAAAHWHCACTHHTRPVRDNTSQA
jgi:hypothetical protein